MSSTDREDPPASPPLQSAQQPADQYYAEREDIDLDSESDYLPDAPSDQGHSPLSSQRESALVDDPGANIISGEDDGDEDSQDSTSFPSRPNGFRGPPSTWRNWTAPERDLAADLEQSRAKDLSVHLYNSFKLGQRNRIRVPDRRNQTSKGSEEANGRSTWVPPKVWTAWPLPPDIVPREQNEKRSEEDVVLPLPHHSSQRRQRRPGQSLQEMLVAQVLRTAKERIYERQWEGTPQSGTTTTASGQQSQGLGRDLNGRSSTKYDDKSPDQIPVIMANDERASEILEATVQHMMTKFDDLLMGLHHARSSYLLTEDSDSESQSQPSERSTSRGRPRKRKREASKPNEDAEASQHTPNHPNSDSDDNHRSSQKSGSRRKILRTRSSPRRSRSHKFRDRKRLLGLRDWSDVLGIASMIGWHQNVVGSTSARCATLFEEGIKFRTLEEGRVPHEEHLYLPNAPPLVSVGHSQSDTLRASEAHSSSFDGAMVGAVHVDGFLKPIEGKKSWIYGNKKQSKRSHSSRQSKKSD